MIDPAEIVIRPRPPWPPSRELIVTLVALAFVFPFLAFLRVPIVVLIVLAMLAVGGIGYRAWNQSRVAYLVGPYHFGYLNPGGARHTWPTTELVKITKATRPMAFGREAFYVLVGRDGRALMAIRPSLITAEDLEKFWTTLGSRP